MLFRSTPNEGLKFTGWDKATEGRFTEDVVITAQYDKLQNVEPGDDEHPEPPNKDYVTVTFEKGEHGEFDGTSRFYVKKNEDVDLTASAPKVVPEDDYKHIGWNKNIKGKFTEDTVITAQYQKLNNVIVLLASPGAIVAAMVAVESAATPVVGWVSVVLVLLATHVVIWLAPL